MGFNVNTWCIKAPLFSLFPARKKMTYNPTIAIIGLKGSIGPSILKGVTTGPFKDSFVSPVHALTRDISQFTSTDRVEYFQADLADKDALLRALKGVDVLINTADIYQTSHFTLIDAAAESGVKVYFPSGYGVDSTRSPFKDAFSLVEKTGDYAEAKGLKVVRVKVSFFVQYFLKVPGILLVNPEDNTYTQVDDGSHEVSFTTERDIAYSLLALARRKPEDLPNKVRIVSQTISANDFVEKYEQYHGKKLTVKHTTKGEVTSNASAMLQMNNLSQADFYSILTAVAYASDGAANFGRENDNDFVNPGIFKWQSFDESAEELRNL